MQENAKIKGTGGVGEGGGGGGDKGGTHLHYALCLENSILVSSTCQILGFSSSATQATI